MKAQLASSPSDVILPPAFKRIYFYHIRRVGGTSLNQTFFELSSSRPELISANIRRSKTKVVCLNGTRRYVGANRSELEEGDYFYGFSHIPSHLLRLPSQTFTITLLRDPVARVLSHYRMVLDYDLRRIQRYWMPLERQWLGKSFGDFCRNLPRERLHAQLFMFSSTFSVGEAVDKIMQCNFAFGTESYSEGVERLSEILHLTLSMRHSHRNTLAVRVSDGELERARDLLKPEYELFSQLRKGGYEW